MRQALNGGSGRHGGKKQPPLMDPTRERDRRRILRLFKPYRARLTSCSR